MRSIRSALVVSFLALLAGALAAVSGLAYRSADQAFRAKEASTRALVNAQHAERSREERSKLDDALLYQAHTLANLVQSQSQGDRWRYQPLHLLGALSAASGWQSHVQLPLWVAAARGPLAYRLWRMSATEIHFPDDLVARLADGPDTEFYQINTEWGGGWRSPSLGADVFPFDAALFAKTPLYDWKFDDGELASGTPVRRVALKAPVSRFRFLWGSAVGRRWPPSRSPASSSPPGSSAPERVAETELPVIFIQCACATAGLEATLAQLRAARDAELAELEIDTAETLRALRQRLLGIGLATFAATVLSGLWLVGRGLVPLRRLSEAVSRVSGHDFRLQFDDRRLPSELRPIVQRLTATLLSLERVFTREKQAAADISHELRTPLAALLATIEVALHKPRSPEEYRQALLGCQLSSQQMHHLVERLLALARLDAGVDQVRVQSVDAVALAEQCVALVRPLADARSVCLALRSHGPIAIAADGAKLREVLLNLLHNAIEYNRPHGSVAIAVERQNGELCLEVQDTGIGISAAVHDRLFERFYRADPARGADDLHAGLGLAIVKGYVDLLGGTIAVHSVDGQGAPFACACRWDETTC